MKRPQNYQELVIVAKQEIDCKIGELEERIEALRRLLRQFDTVTDWSEDNLPGLYIDADMYRDLERAYSLAEIVGGWPEIALPPGERAYW